MYLYGFFLKKNIFWLWIYMVFSGLEGVAYVLFK